MFVERVVHGVFAGGGIKGIALAGAAAGAMDCGYRFDRVVGTSSGAMVASLLAAGCSASELTDAVLEIPWPDLADKPHGSGIPGLGKHLALLTGLGHHRGDKLEQVWRRLLRAKGVRRIADLPSDSLRVVATDLTHQRGLMLPDDLGDYGVTPERFSVARAVRMSTAVPFFFRPVPLRNLRTGETSHFADGALAANFPLRVARWDEGRPVVGFRFVDSQLPKPAVDINGPLSLVRAVVGAAVRASGTLRGTLMDRALMVEIPAERDPLDFAITPAIARHLFDGGRRAAVAFFDEVEEAEALSHFRRPTAMGESG
jgi:NTE family protein